MDMQKYLDFLAELCRTLDSLACLEQRKIAAIRAGDFQALDQCMKQEQAVALDLRGKEQKRIELLRALGLEQFSLRQLPAHCPAEFRGQATEATERLLRSYEVLSSAQQAARTLMEGQLRGIQNELECRQAPPARQSSAAPSGQADFRA